MEMFIDLQHHLWLSVFGILGNIMSSVFLFVAPTTTFIQIFAAGSTMGFDSLPYIVTLFSSMLWMYYGFVRDNANLLISISSIGVVTETTYILMFLIFASIQVRWHTLKELSLCLGGFSFIFLVSWFLFSGAIRVNLVGWISVASCTAVFSSPVSAVLHVLVTRSVEFLPLMYLPFLLSFSAIMWLGYGLMLRDVCIVLPSVIAFSLGFIQILLYAIYWEANPIEGENEYVPEHVMNVEMLGMRNQLVQPVDLNGIAERNPEAH